MAGKLIAFLAGAAIGAGLCGWWLIRQSRTNATAAIESVRAEQAQAIADTQRELESERARAKAARTETDRMAARVEELDLQLAAARRPREEASSKSALAALFKPEGTNANASALSGMMKAAIEQQVEGKVSAMKLRLNLTPDQEAAVREILGREMRRGTEMAEKMFKGELTMEQLQDSAKENLSPVSERDQIKALLTADQQEAYAAYEKEEAQRMARLVANSELLQLEGALQLDPGQQDKVYAVLAEQAQAQFGGQGGGMDLTQMNERKADALKAVLTPEQFAQYRKFQEQQQKMIEAFLPKSGSNATLRSSVIIRANP
jgi:hypothetical protein